MLSKSHRLRDSARINQVKQQGFSWYNRWLVLVKQASKQQPSRFAVSASRKIGGAVVRNRIKRLIREALRHRLPAISDGWDVVLIARHPACHAGYEQIDRAVGDLLIRAELLQVPPPDRSTDLAGK